MNTLTKITLISFSSIILLFAVPVFAADVSLNAKDKSFSPNQEFLLEVSLNADGQSLNAIEGKVVFPSDLLEIKEIRDGNSSINFWIEEPHTTDPNTIAFSGITPGGLSGQGEFLFSVVFRAKSEGSGMVKMEGLRVLQNDGKGTAATVTTLPYSFSISTQIATSSSVEPPKDTEAPEIFTPSVGKDHSIFNGQAFLVFATQDKISGIDHYEVREGFWGSYIVATSPYLLKYQTLDRKIYVKAVDKSGNERVVTFNPQNYVPWYKQYVIFAILLVAICVGFLFKNKWRSFLQKQ